MASFSVCTHACICRSEAGTAQRQIQDIDEGGSKPPVVCEACMLEASAGTFLRLAVKNYFSGIDARYTRTVYAIAILTSP